MPLNKKKKKLKQSKKEEKDNTIKLRLLIFHVKNNELDEYIYAFKNLFYILNNNIFLSFVILFIIS